MTDEPSPDTHSHEIERNFMQASGSGVADLEIAYEQMKLAEAKGDADGTSLDAADARPPADTFGVAET